MYLWHFYLWYQNPKACGRPRGDLCQFKHSDHLLWRFRQFDFVFFFTNWNSTFSFSLISLKKLQMTSLTLFTIAIDCTGVHSMYVQHIDHLKYNTICIEFLILYVDMLMDLNRVLNCIFLLNNTIWIMRKKLIFTLHIWS
jgi:hypothetical protein